METLEPHVLHTYQRLPIALSHGVGCRVWDTEGRVYLDALSGIAVNTLGHAHPEWVGALQHQISQLVHTSNYYHVTLQETLAKKLTELSKMEQVFFCSTGLEANEAALKLARKYGNDKGLINSHIVVFEGAFHGRSMATLSATANPKVHAGFTPLMSGFLRVPRNDLHALKQATENHPITAVMLEAIQGEGGIQPFEVAYLKELRALCDERDWLLIIDEVQCGIGRTGKWFAHQWADIVPDIMPLAKGLGSGVPIGAVVVGAKAKGIFGPGNHGSTFGGNPLAMRAGVETLRIMEQDHLLDHAARMGERLQLGLQQHLGNLKGILEIRGRGLMLGIQLDRPCGVLLERAMQNGLLISVTADSVVRLLPALIIQPNEIDELIARLVPLIRDFLGESDA